MHSLRQLLNYRFLTAAYNSLPAMGEFVLTDNFYVNTQQAPTREFDLVVFNAARAPAPMNQPGAAARVLTPEGGAKRRGVMFRSFNETPVDGDAIDALREPESDTLQEKGRTTLIQSLEQFNQRQRIQKEVILSMILQFGVVYLDNRGEILVPTMNANGTLTAPAGYAFALTFGVNDAQRGEVNVTVPGGAKVVRTKWTEAAADIQAQLEDLRWLSGRAGLPRPNHVWLNSINKRYLRNNTEFKEWAKESGRHVEAVLSGTEIEDLWGFTWHWVDYAWDQTQGGTTYDLIHEDLVVVTPNPGEPWQRAHEGGELISNEVGVVTDLNAALNSLNKVYGRFSYCELKHNPVRLSMFVGENYGFNYAEPGAVYQMNVFA